MGYTARLLWFINQLPLEPRFTYQTYGELFAGMRAWSEGMEMYEFDGLSFDKLYTASDILHTSLRCDFLTPEGFLMVIAHVMRMHVRSVFLAAIPCFSWVSMDTLGDNKEWVITTVDQNALVSRLVYVLILCMKRGVYWIVEQPTSSNVFQHPRWKYMERKYGHLINAVITDLGVYIYDKVRTTVLKGER